MLPTTCHVYFGSVTGARPDGRKAGLPLSAGISPVQGADCRSPAAVIQSAASHSNYFCALSEELQEEITARTEHRRF